MREEEGTDDMSEGIIVVSRLTSNRHQRDECKIYIEIDYGVSRSG